MSESYTWQSGIFDPTRRDPAPLSAPTDMPEPTDACCTAAWLLECAERSPIGRALGTHVLPDGRQVQITVSLSEPMQGRAPVMTPVEQERFERVKARLEAMGVRVTP